MKISLNTFSYPKISPQFKSSSSYYKTEGGKEIGTWTWFFRSDLLWKNFIEYQTEHFKNKDKVNIIQFGASDGTEAFTYLMSLFEFAREEDIDKFTPIKAYDINKGILKHASSGYINIFPDDAKRFNSMGIGLKKYFKTPETEPLQYTPTTLYSVKSKLKERVNFTQGDMFELLPKIEDNSNTVLLCRNCLGYFYDQPDKVKEFIQTAARVLKKDSLFVIGLLEQDEPYILELIQSNNFQKVLDNVYKKL